MTISQSPTSTAVRLCAKIPIRARPRNMLDTDNVTRLITPARRLRQNVIQSPTRESIRSQPGKVSSRNTMIWGSRIKVCKLRKNTVPQWVGIHGKDSMLPRSLSSPDSLSNQESWTACADSSTNPSRRRRRIEDRWRASSGAWINFFPLKAVRPDNLLLISSVFGEPKGARRL